MVLTHKILMVLAVVMILLKPGIGIGSETVQYQYDEMNRLKQATYGDGTVIIYNYDEIGNLLSQTVNKPSMYTITVAQSTGGTIAPSTTSVTNHGYATFYITPDSGYHIVDIIVDNVSQGAWQSYTFSNVSAYHTITASFTQNPPFRIVGRGDYSTLQAAYDGAADGDTIKCQSVTFTGSLTANRNISVTIDGGYNSDYTSNPTKTTLIGMVSINSGTVNIKNFNLQ